MKLTHKLPEVVKKQPYINCKLGREKYGKILTQLVSNYSEGFVLAINNSWGTGKTTFIRMWQQDLKDCEFQTLYFNAWESDFQEEVIIALLSELKELEGKAEKSFQSVMEKTAAFLTKVAPTAAKGVAGKFIGDEAIAEIAKAAVEFTTGEVEILVNEFSAKKKGIIDFRKSLETFVSRVDNKKPVVFFIDELDRCRPDYAVRILEKIKHLFAVPGIIFILAIDKSQLEASIKGFYGGEFNSREYLKRFIDLEFTLPDPDMELAVNHYLEHFGLKEYYSSNKKKSQTTTKEEFDRLKSISVATFNITKEPLRTIEKQMSYFGVVLQSFMPVENTFPEICFLLIHVQNSDPKIFKKIANIVINPQEVIIAIESIYLNGLQIEKKELNNISWALGNLIAHYCRAYWLKHRTSDFILEDDETLEKSTSLKTNMDQKVFSSTFLNRFYDYRIGDISISKMTEKVSLTSGLLNLEEQFGED